ncbi:glycosyltransferase family 2 protein [Plastoroseomonas arctica]|uniref:Glycosyltransferase family 2 protein n=1 Tax=Plastoroseomonas arctica TaxID=1509237 RepID=A0AAF1KJS6_9PROT|nr:glycosyltransferase family 2 protein [Plastoroseomonas arctica]MBR0655740.1 glycosyltransferase family 2 protein [Plastoroseomonas arctica]
MTIAREEPAGAFRPPLLRLSVVIVTYRSAGVIAEALRALPEAVETIIVDNASPDDTLAVARAARPGAVILAQPENRGFGAGCNAGIAAASRELVLLLNPDGRIATSALGTLIAAADAYPDAAILAPALLDDDGKPVRSWDAAQVRRRALDRNRRSESWPAAPFCAEFVSGACMLLRRADGLRFDEAFFLYYEDDDLCAAARAMGRSIVVVPAARAGHAGGKSSAPSRRVAWIKAYHLAWSRLRYLEKHGGKAEALGRLRHHAGKAIGHALTLRGGRAWADIAGFWGTLAWLRGRR